MAASSTYLKLVRRGKELIQEINTLDLKLIDYQTKIVILAVKACDIKHGGYSQSCYTIKQFAEDTGAPYRLLLNWSRVYRNILMKKGINSPTTKDWATARRVDLVFKNERACINKENGMGGTKKPYIGKIPKARVIEIYDEIEEKPFVYEVEKLLASAKHIKFILSKRDLKIANPKRLIELMENLDNASDLINDFLTPKKIRVVQ